MSAPAEEPRLLRIGQIVGCFGVKGEVKIRPVSSEPDWVKHLKEVIVQKAGKPTQKMTIASMSFRERLVYTKFDCFPSRTEAEFWVGATVFARAEDLPAITEESTYRVDELVGLVVLDAETRREIGRVQDLLTASGSDFLEIKLHANQDTMIIPFIDVFFPLVNISEKFICLDKLQDLIEDAP